MLTNEPARISALRRYRQMDSPREEAFHDIAATAAALFQVPIAAITLVDDSREWCKAIVGADIAEVPRALAFSTLVLEQPDLLILSDVSSDARFQGNPFAVAPACVRFCAGAPLTTPDGFVLGALLVMDRAPREFDAEAREALRRLARQTSTLLEMKRSVAHLTCVIDKRKRVTKALEERTRSLAAQKQELEARTQELEISNEDMHDGAILYEYASQRFLELFQGLPVACLCYDAKGRIFEWNRAFETLYGIGAEDTLLKPIWEAICQPSESEAMKDVVARVFGGETFEGIERADLRADGSVCYVLCNAFPIRHADGGIIGGICANVDITQRKQTQEALRQSEERYRQTFQHHGAVKLLIDAQTEEIVDANPAACAFYGCSFEEMRRRTMSDINVFDDGKVGDEMALAAAEDRPYYNLRHRVANDEVRDVEVHTGPVNIGGRLHQYSIVHDVTERRLAEMARRESELRFRSVTQSANDAIVTVTQEDQIISWNNGARKMFGYTEEEIFGRQLDLILPSLYANAAPGDKSKILNRTIEIAGRRQDGGEPPLELSLATWDTEQGTFFSAVIRDITERKRYERQLQEQMEQINNYSVELEFHKSRLESINRKLEELAKLDGMTGLKNHRAFQERMEAEFTRSMRYTMPLSLLLLDIDNFKAYNDSFGHPAGDEVLKSVAQILQDNARGVDLIARYGGEEFVVILPHTDSDGAVAIAERFRAAINAGQWANRAITVSVGVATLTPAIMEIPVMIEYADRALQASKRTGKNCVTHADNAGEAPAPAPLPVKR
ncbi:hypothetical protein CCAX7_007390 [Capsulimonas corticalis]|uniref:Uncharacterized protein n=1 Tax=Capsulimonas corticalis TaxID=2219043 RepID=A0A402D1S9_9BACT|nr:PAS domain S-box protein [Capsulimonas corticalis]BDI28688.1 hypothetical protein CCAX7_007390 [Capsulimonas corticalis]